MQHFVHLHRHSEYSIIDGSGKDGCGSSKVFVEATLKNNQPALAITDHGNLCGVYDHITDCLSAGITPIVGLEAYVKDNRLIQTTENKKSFHTTLWAKNLSGYKNLLQITSQSHSTGFYHKPCADWDLFSSYSDGLIASTGCLSSPLSKAILDEDHSRVEFIIRKLKSIFGSDVYVEIMPHAIPDQVTVNKELISIAEDNSWPLVATVDAHYPYQDWAETQDVALMIATGQSFKSREKQINEGKASYKYDVDTFYLQSDQEVKDLFAKTNPDIPASIIESACSNTTLILDDYSPFILDKSSKMPKVSSSLNVSEHIRKICNDRLNSLFDGNPPSLYVDRFEYEFSVLESKNAIDYFYIVYDLVDWCSSVGIRVGVGRGSAAGSLISYLLGITRLDPIPHGFVFERFLNPDRDGMPDIDIDFQHDRRNEVKQYLATKYGAERVADISSFQTFKTKSAVKDVSRIFGVDFSVVTKITKDIDDSKHSLNDFDSLPDNLKVFLRENKEIYSHASRLLGQVKSQSKHPAGVVVTENPIVNDCALMRGKNGDLVTQWSEQIGKNTITANGFPKFDILSSDGLTCQQRTIDLIKSRHSVYEDVDSIGIFSDPDDVDDDVMNAWRSGDTFGVLQFAGQGITSLIKNIQPTGFGDIAAANALYRPGPLNSGTAYSYADRKNGKEPITYWHESVKPFFESTFGLLVYQEQVMKVCEHIGGFSLAEADTVRKAITKWTGEKAHQYLDSWKDKFFNHAQKSLGIPSATVESIWSALLEFTKYSFNSAHSACYAAHAYQDMFLKVKYPLEFYTSLLSLTSDIPVVIEECHLKGISVSPPDINTSLSDFSISDDGIIYGLSSIKYVGNNLVKKIVEERSKRPFSSYDDFVSRMPKRACNSRALDHLVLSGCFRHISPNMSPEDVDSGYVESLGHDFNVVVITDEDNDFMANNMFFMGDLPDDIAVNTRVLLGGIATRCKTICTKKGDPMAFVDIQFKSQTVPVVVFPNVFSQCSGILVDKEKVFVEFYVNKQNSFVATKLGKLMSYGL